MCESDLQKISSSYSFNINVLTDCNIIITASREKLVRSWGTVIKMNDKKVLAMKACEFESSDGKCCCFRCSSGLEPIGEASASLLSPSDISFDKTEEDLETSYLRSGKKWRRSAVGRPSAPDDDGDTKTTAKRSRRTVSTYLTGSAYFCFELFAVWDSVSTNQEKLEYSGISVNMENSGNSVQPQGKIVVTHRGIFSSSFKYFFKTAVDWVNRIIKISGSSDPAR